MSAFLQTDVWSFLSLPCLALEVCQRGCNGIVLVNLWWKMSLFCSMNEGVSYLYLSAATYLLFCHVQPPPRSAVPHGCCRPSNGRKMQALTAVEWLTAVRYKTDEQLTNDWTDGLPKNRLTGLGAGLPLTYPLRWAVECFICRTEWWC